MAQSTEGVVVDLSSGMMNAMWALLYRFVIGIARLASPLFSKGDSKLARGLEGRRHAHELLVLWGESVRDRSRPTIWVHAPSVGEGLQAQSVVRALRLLRPELQVVFTFFSPSAEALAQEFGADVATYLPWDQKSPISAALDAIHPDLVCFTKTEVWPVLVEEAVHRCIPVSIVATTVTKRSKRNRWLARTLLRPTWAKLTLVSANTDQDSKRIALLGVPGAAIRTTGDPGIDSALDRVAVADAEASYLAPFHAYSRPTLVAGSTWPSDDAVLLPALARAREAVSGLRVVIAPHEPEERGVSDLMARFRRDGWRVATLSEVESTRTARGVDVVVVERVGPLAQLYSIASVAYVGGGFHQMGLHSVLEPAASTVPVVFGPYHTNARAAGDLVTSGGAIVTKEVDELTDTLIRWFTSEEDRLGAGEAAFGYIERHQGAADRTAALLDDLLQPARP
jgi:3-deoxy-D-manno-octulosonic-acid transferase